ncbi:MAG: TonB-dependent receptor plug domain-containing protein [Sphingomonadaceae bacterium]
MAAPYANAKPFADTIQITASRIPAASSDTISDTLTIGAEQIAQSGAGNIVDLLQRQRGIEIARNGGAGTTSSVFIRGANGNQSIVLVDGVRIASSTTGTANWSAIPLTAIDHIEIVYGPLSTMYGADAIGGVIQIFTRKGDGAPALTAFAGYGSDNTRAADIAISGSSGSEHPLRYALSAGKEQSDGYSATRDGQFSYNPDRDGYDKQSVAAQVSLQLAAGHEIGALLVHSKMEAQYDNGVKIAYDTHNQQQLQTTAVYTRNQILPNWSSLLQVAQARDELGSYTNTSADGISQLDTRQTSYSWQNDVRIGDDTLQLLYDRREEEVISSSTPVLNRSRSTNAYAASYHAQRGEHLIETSIRRDNSIYGAQNTGAAGYAYRITPALRASASIGTSFRAPTYNELYYPGFGLPSNRPEHGRNRELGLRYDDGLTLLNASYYHNRLTDLLVTSTPCPGTGKSSCAYNVNHALLQGLTLSGSRKLGHFRLNASVDLQDPVDETTDKRLARRAQRHGSLALDYSAGALSGGVELQASGERFDDAANKNRLGGYALLNLYASWRFTQDWSALVRWNNVANKQYDLARYYNTPGSKVFAGLRYGYK